MGTFSSFSKQQHHRRKSIMKVFYFIFCIASASCLSFDSKDQEDFHYFLKSANDRSARSFGLSERSAPVCSEKNFTVNGDPYTLLFNEEECPKDKYIGENVLRKSNDGSIVTKDNKTVLEGDTIDKDIFNQIFPGFEQKTATTSTATTTTTSTTTATTTSDSMTSQPNIGNHATVSYIIATLLFLKQ